MLIETKLVVEKRKDTNEEDLKIKRLINGDDYDDDDDLWEERLVDCLVDTENKIAFYSSPVEKDRFIVVDSLAGLELVGDLKKIKEAYKSLA